MSQTAAHLVDHVIPHVPLRQWVLPIPLRVLLAAQPELVTPVLQVVQRVVARHLRDSAQLTADEGHGGAVTLIQRFGSAANLDIHLHCLMLDGVYRCDADGRGQRLQRCPPPAPSTTCPQPSTIGEEPKNRAPIHCPRLQQIDSLRVADLRPLQART